MPPWVLMLTLAFASILVSSSGKEIFVDPILGVDNTSCLNDTLNMPCRSLAFAVYQREVERNDSIFETRQTPPGTELSDVVFTLRPGMYQADVPILILNATNVTIRAMDPTNDTSVRCVSFPNNGSGEGFGPNGTNQFDDLRIDRSTGVVLEGLIFEECGPITSAVFVTASVDITVTNCTFRYAQGLGRGPWGGPLWEGSRGGAMGEGSRGRSHGGGVQGEEPWGGVQGRSHGGGVQGEEPWGRGTGEELCFYANLYCCFRLFWPESSGK